MTVQLTALTIRRHGLKWHWEVRWSDGLRHTGNAWRYRTARRELFVALLEDTKVNTEIEKGEFKDKMKSINFGRVPGGARERS